MTEFHCSKEREIAALETSVTLLNQKVIGKDGLAETVPLLKKSVDDLTVTTRNLDRNLGKIAGEREHDKGEKEGKAYIRRRQQWLIGLLIGVIITQLGILIKLIS